MQEPQTQGMRLHRACAKLDSGAVRQARNALEDAGRALPTQATHAEVVRLVANDVAQEEREATAHECKLTRAEAAKQQGAPTEIIKRLCRQMAAAAEQGPSNWRNADITAVCRAEHGPQTLRLWMQQWHTATASEFTQNLWGAALVTPLDCGEKKLTPEEVQALDGPPPRKLRPIALSEPLLKLAESAAVDWHSS